MDDEHAGGKHLQAYAEKLTRTEGQVTCAVCAAALAGTMAFCPACDTPYHPECWNYNRGCAVYGCKPAQAKARLVQPPPLASRRTRLDVLALSSGCLVFGLLMGSILTKAEERPMRAAQPIILPSPVPAPAPAPGKEPWMLQLDRLSSLANRMDREAYEELLAALKQPDGVLGGVHARTTAATTLAKAGWKEAIPAIVEALDAEETFFARPEYCAALFQLGSPEGASRLERMIDGYKPNMDTLTEDAHMRKLDALGAADTAAQLGIDRLRPKVEAFLQDTNPEVVKQVLVAMRKYNAKKSIPAVAKLLFRDDCSLVYEACQVLVQLGARSHRAKIEGALKRCPSHLSGLPELLQQLGTDTPGPKRIKLLFATLEEEIGPDGKKRMKMKRLGQPGP